MRNSRNPRPGTKNSKIQGIPGLEQKILKLKESQTWNKKFQNSKNARPGTKNSEIQGIPGPEQKFLKIKDPGLPDAVRILVKPGTQKPNFTLRSIGKLSVFGT